MIIEQFLVVGISIAVVFLVGARFRNDGCPVHSETVFLVFYVFFGLFGTLALYLQLDTRRLNEIIPNDIILLQIWTGSTLSVCIILLTCWVVKGAIGSQVSLKKNQQDENGIRDLLLTTLFCTCTIVYLVMFTPPLVILLKGGGVVEAFNARQSSSSSVGFFKISHIKFFTHQAQMFWVLYLYIKFLIFKRKQDAMIFCVAIVSLALALSSGLSKGGIVHLVGALGLIYLFYRKRNLSLVKIIFLFSFLLVIAVGMQSLFLPTAEDASFFHLYGAVLSRVTTGQIEPAYYVFTLIDSEGFLFGSTFPNPKSVFPFDHYDLETKTWEMMNPDRVLRGLSFRNPTSFWVEGYANFGWVGVIIFSMVVGALLSFIDVYFGRLGNLSPLKLALLAYLSLHYARLSGKGLTSFIWDLDVLFVVAFYLLVSMRLKSPINIH